MKKIFDKSSPIISSLLETDTYKIRMLYFIWKFFPDVKTKFAFTNRTSSVKLGNFVNPLAEFEAVRDMRFSTEEIDFLRKNEQFPEEFLQLLTNLRLSDIDVNVNKDGQLEIETAEDYWTKTTLWELLVLPIVNELYFREAVRRENISEADIIREGTRRLTEKANMLSGSGVKAMQFGLRRRLSGDWERYVTQMALELMPDVVVAVSNVQLARELGVPYAGTNAHELSMALNAIRWQCGQQAAWQAQYEVFEKWFNLFPQEQRIILPDTFGSKQFLDNLPEELAYLARGFRQDSGNPVEFGYWVIEMYKRFDINPMERVLIFSDGLTPAKMLELQKEFAGKINVLFGWGTNFSNDTGFLKALSIVMKLVLANGSDAVKLGDNIAKAIGQKDAIERNKALFGYNVTLNEKCVY